jgi:hypothetical protein
VRLSQNKLKINQLDFVLLLWEILLILGFVEPSKLLHHCAIWTCIIAGYISQLPVSISYISVIDGLNHEVNLYLVCDAKLVQNFEQSTTKALAIV